MKNWKIKSIDPTEYQSLIDQQINPQQAFLMSLRHIKNPQKFFDPLNQKLYDPYLFNDMPKVYQRLKQAYDQHEKVLIYGDYDVDGVTSTSIMINLLKNLGINYDYYIPKRNIDGYGPNLQRYQQLLAEHHYDLFITVDNGITGIKEIEYLNQQHVDTIIIDHHTFGDQLPNAYAIIHPSIPGSNYPEAVLSGAGVCFKVMQAITPELSQHFYDLAALGIVADCMDIIGENRIIVARGLQQMQQKNNLGISTLIRENKLPMDHLTTTDIGFSIAPALNAAGRLKDAKRDVELLTTNDYQQAYEIAKELIEDNKERKSITKELSEQARNQINPKNHANIIVLQDVQKGLVGLIANQIMNITGKPTLALVQHNDELSGSARSCNGFDLTKTLRPLVGTVLESFGGHALACGLSLKQVNLPLLQQILNDACVDLKPQPLIIDCQVDAQNLAQFEHASELFEPFGNANQKFEILTKITVDQCTHIGKDNSSLKIKAKNIPNVEFIGFSDFSTIDFDPNETIYLVGTVSLHYWKDQISLQFIIDDFARDLQSDVNIL